LEEQKIVTYKQIASKLGISKGAAQKYATNARLFYDKKAKEGITWGQVLKANRLEK
jgi:hypothetical protein